MSEVPKYPDARPEMQELYMERWTKMKSAQEALCGTAVNADTSTNVAILPTVKNASPSGEVLLPDAEWNSLSLESQHKLQTWFRLASERLQAILDEPVMKTPGEDAWMDEIAHAIVGGGLMVNRDKLRTILRAYRANLKQQEQPKI
jgi:hypothetical protein